MSKFKVGDHVRKNISGFEGVVTHVGPHAINGIVTKTGECNRKIGDKFGDIKEYFEILSPESELERLVRVANEGIAALRTLLNNHRKEIEDEDGREVPNHLIFKVRVKRAPAPITLSTGWRVEIDGDRVRVGCREFDAKELKEGLLQLCSYQVSKFAPVGYNIELRASRKGIRDSTCVLPWDDADKLLAYLEEHSGGVK